jgi:hypothetical protein
MEYFAGLDVSMSETHVCVVTQDGAVIHEVRAPMLYHGLSQLGLPVVCVESRQAYQALKSLRRTRPTATMHAAWRISPAPASSSSFM